MKPEQMARLVAGDFDCHDYVEINVGGTGPNEADFETLDTPVCVIRELATELTTLQQEKAALLHHEALIEARTQRGITDCSTPLFVRVENIVAQLEKAERERDECREALAFAPVIMPGSVEYRVTQAEATTRRAIAAVAARDELLRRIYQQNRRADIAEVIDTTKANHAIEQVWLDHPSAALSGRKAVTP